MLSMLLGGLAVLSVGIMIWQAVVAFRFPLHRSSSGRGRVAPVTLLKPLKGCDEFTETCLRSWFKQEYPEPVQIIFGVASAQDPVCGIVHRLMEEHPKVDAVLKVFSPLQGTNLKVAKLVEMERMASHRLLVVSDADVCAPTDLLSNVVSQLLVADAGLVHCFYRLEPPGTLAMRCEAVAVNADFWSQALQSSSFRPVDFALGAVMAFRKKDLSSIGGFEALKNCLADDYQIGHRIAGQGRHILFSSVVVECWSGTMGWGAVWRHQVRWARTIRVSQPVPYFMSILSNATLWGFACMGQGSGWAVLLGGFVLGVRSVLAVSLQNRLRRGVVEWAWFWVPWLKDIMQIGIWSMAFMGNTIEWRGERMRLERDGTLHPMRPDTRQ